MWSLGMVASVIGLTRKRKAALLSLTEASSLDLSPTHPSPADSLLSLIPQHFLIPFPSPPLVQRFTVLFRSSKSQANIYAMHHNIGRSHGSRLVQKRADTCMLLSSLSPRSRMHV